MAFGENMMFGAVLVAIGSWMLVINSTHDDWKCPRECSASVELTTRTQALECLNGCQE